MSNLTSSSTSMSDEEFLGFDEDFSNIGPDATADSIAASHTPFIDARRRLESMLEEKNLEKDIKEFDFDF